MTHVSELLLEFQRANTCQRVEDLSPDPAVSSVSWSPARGKVAGKGSAGEGKREGASGPPSVSLACFNPGPMRPPTKEPGWNHRLLLCCTGSQRGCEGPRRFAGCSRRHSRPPALFALEIVLSRVTVKGACSRHDILHCHRSPPPTTTLFFPRAGQTGAGRRSQTHLIQLFTRSWKMMIIHEEQHNIQSEQCRPGQ